MYLKKIVLLFIVVAFLTSFVSGCSREKKKAVQDEGIKKTEVVYWLGDFGAPRTKHMRKIINVFNEKNDMNIFVKVQIIPVTGGITGIDSKLLPAIVAGTAPDVIVTVENHHVLTAEGIIQEITQYVENDKKFSMDQFYPQKIEDCYYNGKLYSLPFQLDINGFLIWNQDLFKKSGIDPNAQPKTLTELDEFAEKIFKIDNETGLYETVGYVPWTWLNTHNNSIERIFNVKLNNPDGSPNILNDRMIEAYQWVDKYIKKYGYQKVKDSLKGQEIAGGRLGMQYAWIEELNHLRNSKVSFNWSIGPFPKEHADAEPLWLGGCFMSVVKDSKVAAEAVEFMKFYCGIPGSEIAVNSYLDEYGELTTTVPNQTVMERYVDRMPDKYKILITDILPQMIVNRQDKLVTPATYEKLLQGFRKNVFESSGEVSGLITDLQKKMEFEWAEWLKRREAREDVN